MAQGGTRSCGNTSERLPYARHSLRAGERTAVVVSALAHNASRKPGVRSYGRANQQYRINAGTGGRGRENIVD
jgi:hypothetical protein